MFDMKLVKKAVAEYLLGQAEFRHLKAVKYVGARNDSRNEKSAKAIEALADYVTKMDDDDSFLHRLIAMPELFCPQPHDVINMPYFPDGSTSQSSRFVIRVGFDAPTNPTEFFPKWIGIIEEEYPDYLKMLAEWAGI